MAPEGATAPTTTPLFFLPQKKHQQKPSPPCFLPEGTCGFPGRAARRPPPEAGSRWGAQRQSMGTRLLPQGCRVAGSPPGHGGKAGRRAGARLHKLPHARPRLPCRGVREAAPRATGDGHGCCLRPSWPPAWLPLQQGGRRVSG